MTNAKPSVLVADDEPGITSMYVEWLSDSYDVSTATDGEEAFERMNENVDVVILDRYMPVTSGDEFLRKCRNAGWDCQIAIVSAVDSGGDVLDLGFDEYVHKPVRKAELRDVVERLLRRRTYSQQIQEYFSIVSRLAVVDPTGLRPEYRDTYRELQEKSDELRARLDRLAVALDDRDLRAILREPEIEDRCTYSVSTNR